MSKLLLLYGYNNYFNRIMKKEASIESYKTAVGVGNYAELNDTNFNVTDGVNARHVFNISSFLDGKSPDYLVREYNGNLERWFVLESVKIMGNQIQLSLRRDLVADFYDQIKVAPAFIKKGNLRAGSSLIFNKEGMDFNQIKKKEILLKDYTKCSWVVGYLARHETPEINKTISAKIDHIAGDVTEYDNLPQAIKNIINHDAKVIDEAKMKLTFKILHTFYARGDSYTSGKNISFDIVNKEILGSSERPVNKEENCNYFRTLVGSSSSYNEIEEINRAIKYHSHNITDIQEAIINDNNLSSLQYAIESNLLKTWNNRIVQIDETHFKRIRFTELGYSEDINEDIKYTELNTTNLGSVIKDIKNYLRTNYSHWTDDSISSQTKNIVEVVYNYKKYRVYLENVYTSVITASINEQFYNKLNDAPYDMFAIPMGDNLIINAGEQLQNVPVDGQVALPFARAMKVSLGANVYDIQILPFCPIPDMIINDIFDPEDFESFKDYVLITNEEDVPVSFILFGTSSKGSYNVDVSNVEELQLKSDNIERKIEAETILARLVSPNFSGSFDFNPQKNGGVTTINIDFNAKPYTPYIHVCQILGGLYGEDFNDARGLICGGDFSISATSSQWEEYQIQNKNFENIFNRQIENLDVNNSIAMEKAKYTAVIGTISAGLTTGIEGAVAGSKTPVGAVAGGFIGAAIGTTLSAIGATKDVELLGKQQSENRDYAVDMYTYNLQNIQALPYTLSKVSAYNENNKIFPFIEIYDCTEIEKQNLRDKIKYNGMTVMVQGKIEDYIINEGDYIQAQLIRLEGLNEDNHAVTEIYNELMKGVYIYG